MLKYSNVQFKIYGKWPKANITYASFQCSLLVWGFVQAHPNNAAVIVCALFSFVPRPCDLDTRLLLCVCNYLLAMTSLTDSAAEMLEGRHHRQ